VGEMPDIVKAIALNNKVDESRDFAKDVQRAMYERLRPTNRTLRDLDAKQAPFVVLIGATMLSVLEETSFVTNPQEGRLLKGNAYRQKIAESLFNAIKKYQGRKSVTIMPDCSRELALVRRDSRDFEVRESSSRLGVARAL
jgi:N-acetylmuramoyl-L-alanine amidase